MRRPNRKLLINFVSGFDGMKRDAGLERQTGPETTFEPPTDIYETSDSIVVRMEIAGMAADAIDLSIDEPRGRLTISGCRVEGGEEARRRYYALEIASGPLTRVVQLARPVVAENAVAAYENGFLVVRLPLRTEEPRQPRSVPIQ